VNDDDQTADCPQCNFSVPFKSDEPKPVEVTETDIDEKRKKISAYKKVFHQLRKEAIRPLWEVKDRYGILTRFVNTWKQVVTSPNQFFYHLPSDESKGVLSFGVILLCLVCVFYGIISIVTMPPFEEFARQVGQIKPDMLNYPWFNQDFFRTIYLYQILLSPIISFVAIYIFAGLYHIGLMMLNANHRGYNGTFRVTVYGFAPILLVCLPSCLGSIGLVWAISLHIIGISRFHRLQPAVALLAVLVPLLSLFCFLSSFMGSILKL